MSTGTDLIQDALEKLGVYAAGEVVSLADLTRCGVVLNNMTDQWIDEYLYIDTLTPIAITLAQDKIAYTIGTGVGGADIIQRRPARLQLGPNGASLSAGSPATVSAVNVVTRLEWRALQTTDVEGRPDTLWYDPQYPLAAFYVSPEPGAAMVGGTLTVQGWTPFSNFPDLTTAYTFANGVEQVIKDNLAIMLKPYFTVAALDPAVAISAAHGKAMLRYTNMASRAMLERVPAMQAQGAARAGP